jgi:hypothetical protein
MHHPFLAPEFVSALGSLPRERRFAGRTEALEALFAGVLPPGLESRSSKAVFAGALWGAASREFASRWDGSGVDTDVVDVEVLRRRWQSETPGPHTLLQSLWLAQAAAAPSTSSSASGSADQERGRRSSHAGSALN